jgi:hypothetical protein
VQNKLSFMKDMPVPHRSVWDQLQEEHKNAVLEMLARVIAKMIATEQQPGTNHDR